MLKIKIEVVCKASKKDTHDMSAEKKIKLCLLGIFCTTNNYIKIQCICMLPSAPRIIPKSTTTNRKLQGPIQEDFNGVVAFRHIMILNIDVNELRGPEYLLVGWQLLAYQSIGAII